VLKWKKQEKKKIKNIPWRGRHRSGRRKRRRKRLADGASVEEEEEAPCVRRIGSAGSCG
jgi:hypothetical protein